MAIVYRSSATVQFFAQLQLNEFEARALVKLTDWGKAPFVKALTEVAGREADNNLRAGMSSFFDTIRNQVMPDLGDIEEARRVLDRAVKERTERAALARVDATPVSEPVSVVAAEAPDRNSREDQNQ